MFVIPREREREEFLRTSPLIFDVLLDTLLTRKHVMSFSSSDDLSSKNTHNNKTWFQQNKLACVGGLWLTHDRHFFLATRVAKLQNANFRESYSLAFVFASDNFIRFIGRERGGILRPKV